MLKWIAGLIFTLGFAMGAMAQDQEIEGVISSQLEAFERDDFEEAFTFAAPNIRGIFRTPENFGVMVQRGYPMVWRPGDVEFLDLQNQSGRVTQTVKIEDAAGTVHYLAYSMVETGEGWKIAGVQILQAPGVNA